MKGAQNADDFIIFVILLIASVQLPRGWAKDRRDSDLNKLSRTMTKGPQNFCPETMMNESRLLSWCIVVLDQYNVSAESMAMKQRELVHIWRSCPTPIVVNYSDPLTQAAYIWNTLPFSASVLTQIIAETPKLNALFYDDRPLLNIVAVGSGPGTEMAGVLNYLINYHRLPFPMVRFLLVDTLIEWRWAIDLMENVIRSDDVRPRFEKFFYEWDIAGRRIDGDPQTALHRLPSVLTGDLFTFILSFSPILCSMESNLTSVLHGVTQNLRQLVSSAPNGALFLFVDLESVYQDAVRILEPTVFHPLNTTKVVDRGHLHLSQNKRIKVDPSGDTDHAFFFLLYQKEVTARSNLKKITTV